MPTWTLPLASLLFMLAAPVLAWWGSTRYFSGQFTEWRKNSEEWRQRADVRMDRLESIMQGGLASVVVERLRRAEQDIVQLREWKHLRVEPCMVAVDVLKVRIDAMQGRDGSR